MYHLLIKFRIFEKNDLYIKSLPKMSPKNKQQFRMPKTQKVNFLLKKGTSERENCSNSHSQFRLKMSIEEKLLKPNILRMLYAIIAEEQGQTMPNR